MRNSGEDTDARLWMLVAATIRPLPGRTRPRSPAAPREAAKPAPLPPVAASSSAAPPPAATPPPVKARGPQVRRPPHPPQDIEPGRRRRLERGRDAPAAHIDLHGLDQDQARAALTAFMLRGWAEHRRVILVITGKGSSGDGVLRRRVPEWLSQPPLRQIVAGLSEAHRRHGGGGALYVALKRAETR
jgi:DNA-nicking Smr family endonuclease